MNRILRTYPFYADMSYFFLQARRNGASDARNRRRELLLLRTSVVAHTTDGRLDPDAFSGGGHRRLFI